MRYIEVQCETCKADFGYWREKDYGGRYRKVCDMCQREAHLQSRRDINRRRRIKQGRLVDCGSGGNQWGENNHRFKTGVGKPYYRRVCFTYHDPKCIHCGFVTLHPKFSDICVHHVDHNRYNNEADNLVPVCKACHQNIEHVQRRLNGRYNGMPK